MEENKGINSDVLKITAYLTMIIDHIGLVFYGMLPETAYIMCRCAGRISFPIFAFCITEGYVHTSDVRKYTGRILAMAFVSEIPFNLMTGGSILYAGKSNVLFTFAAGLAILAFVEHSRSIIASFAVTAAGMALCIFMKTDYSWIGIAYIMVMYYTRGMGWIRYVCASVILWMNGSILNLAAPAALIPIHFYNGKKGRMSKMAAYLVYPLHMILLVTVREVVLNV